MLFAGALQRLAKLRGASKNLLRRHLLRLRAALCTSIAAFLGATSAPLATVFRVPLRGKRTVLYCLFSCLCCLPGLVSAKADMAKTLRMAFKSAETGFDPAQVSDVYSNDVIRSIFDSLLTYDYLARPAKLVPNVVESMPQVNHNATEFIFKIKPGIFFSNHPVFQGKPRELVAADYVYSLKRLIDPNMRSPNNYMFDGKFVGAQALVEASKNGAKFDYDTAIDGLQVVDRYTLKIRLNQPDYKFLYFLATVNCGAVAREVVEKYGMQEMMANPVGTGPYLLDRWVRGSKIVLVANPNYRHEVFSAQGNGKEDKNPARNEAAQDRAVLAAMQGKTLPQIGRIEISVMDEAQPRWLAFSGNALDYVVVPPDFIPKALPNGKLPAEMEKRGVAHQSVVAPGTFYSFFNLDDPLLGGYTPDRIALRRAIILGYRISENIAQVYFGQAIAAQGPISPGVDGYDPTFRTGQNYDPKLARALLDHYGYKDINGDGYRETPDGKPLQIEKGSTPSSQDNLEDEIWKRSMDAIGLKIVFTKQKWPDLVKAARLGKLPMWNVGWAAQIPDGDSYLQLLYGANKGANNMARFDLPAFNQRYEKANQMPPGKQRDQLYNEMSLLTAGYSVWHMGVHRIENHLAQPWLLGYKVHPFLTNAFKYFDIDLSKKQAPNASISNASNPAMPPSGNLEKPPAQASLAPASLALH